MKKLFYKISEKLFDSLFKKIESTKSFRLISTSLVFIFLGSILFIFLKKNGAFGINFSSYIPDSYFFSVEIVFKILLAIEIIEMVFMLAYSISDSMAKQFEIFSLILLRQAFKEFSYIDLPINIEHTTEPMMFIMSDIFGALIIFAGVYIFSKTQKYVEITCDPSEKTNFESAKKGLAVFMIFTFIIIGIYDVFLYWKGSNYFQFFTMFYSVLIFTDILIVIISLRYNHKYSVVFRNTAYAIATILIRFALSLPHFYNALMGITALIFVILLSHIYNKIDIRDRKIENKKSILE